MLSLETEATLAERCPEPIEPVLDARGVFRMRGHERHFVVAAIEHESGELSRCGRVVGVDGGGGDAFEVAVDEDEGILLERKPEQARVVELAIDREYDQAVDGPPADQFVDGLLLD